MKIELIRSILEQHPTTRNCDYRLLYFVLKSEGVDPDKISATELLSKMNKGECSAFEMVSRGRRLMQEKHPYLIATDPEVRKRRGQKEIEMKQQILNLK